MNGKTVRTVRTIALISIFSVAAFASDQQVVLTSATVNSGTLLITGLNLTSETSTPMVILRTTPIQVVSATPTQIIATLPTPLPPPATYRLTVSTANGGDLDSNHVGSLDLTLGAGGQQGPVGPTGAAGTAGPVGPVGPTGASGLAGPIGATGLAGPAGATGATGVAGPAGATGATGAAGPAGATGATGVAGPAGATGATGIAGPAGATGPAGPAGPTGATGVAGLNGAAGEVGATGATGISNYSQSVRTDSNQSLAPNAETSALLSCPAGTAVLSGGVTFQNRTGYWVVTTNGPLNGSTWQINLANISGSTISASQIIYTIICATAD